MISKSILGTAVADQLSEFSLPKKTVPRRVFSSVAHYDGASALVVKGVRRCGKSTLLKQALKEKFGSDFFYFNFDDERVYGTL